MYLRTPRENTLLTTLQQAAERVRPALDLGARPFGTQLYVMGCTVDQYRQFSEALDAQHIQFATGGMRYNAADYGHLSLDLTKAQMAGEAQSSWVTRATAFTRQNRSR